MRISVCHHYVTNNYYICYEIIKNKLWICTSVSVKATADRMGYTKVIEDAGGNVVCDTCMVVAPIEEMGFEEVEETLPAAPIEEVIPRTIFTKLEIRRALRRLGLEDRLDEILNADSTLKKDWEDAQEIDINDEMIQEAILNGVISRELFDEVVEALRE